MQFCTKKIQTFGKIFNSKFESYNLGGRVVASFNLEFKIINGPFPCTLPPDTNTSEDTGGGDRRQVDTDLSFREVWKKGKEIFHPGVSGLVGSKQG